MPPFFANRLNRALLHLARMPVNLILLRETLVIYALVLHFLNACTNSVSIGRAVIFSLF